MRQTFPGCLIPESPCAGCRDLGVAASCCSPPSHHPIDSLFLPERTGFRIGRALRHRRDPQRPPKRASRIAAARPFSFGRALAQQAATRASTREARAPAKGDGLQSRGPEQGPRSGLSARRRSPGRARSRRCLRVSGRTSLRRDRAWRGCVPAFRHACGS